MKYNIAIISILVSILISCQQQQKHADMVLINANIYTVNKDQPKAAALAIIGDTIAFVGSYEEAAQWISDSTNVLDIKGKMVSPGFIEGHAHLMGIGKNLLNVDLSGTKSYDEVVELVRRRALETKKGDWILGRGWHQDKWDELPENVIGGFPSHHKLSEVTPDNPVFLSHASGHAALVNYKAMEMAGVSDKTPDPSGGEIFHDMGGFPTGVLNETAQDLVAEIIPKDSPERNEKALQLALAECAKFGLTGFHDAGADSTMLELYKSFGEGNKLTTRLYIMLSGDRRELIDAYSNQGPQIGLADNFLTIRSIKLYADGALGSRGALLLEEYSDAPSVHGLRIHELDYIKEIADLGSKSGFQINTHCIGDRANREILDLYEKIYDSLNLTNGRFRIEHAQHISAQDIPRFGQLGVIPSMQAIHMSSDRPWAIDRLGKARIEEGAYVWNKLTQTGATIVNGTDAPVEPLNPIPCFYASVSRQTLKGTPTGGFEPEQKMTRMEALKSYTINNAYGAFEEDIKGSIEVGKLADLTVFSQDIMQVPDDEILNTEVLYTIVGGKIRYQKE